ncbi:MAG: response regulator [Hyphomonas oceanitis]|uniref:Two-component response regulator n=1 Tax=Hyphomonas oceanitis SCH89 TaxID=1280953 RepID=A0A059G8A7_9PROT|nr:response regulator [Hyphomonas oceanitis]KDA02713.1 two-component response regulator [Hyphomonas oceanitis SCH89]
MLSDLIESELPFLRRYARAVVGSQEVGDQLVSTMMELHLLPQVASGDTDFNRTRLYKSLDEVLAEPREASPPDDILVKLGALERRALLLASVEAFPVDDIALILGISDTEVETALSNAEAALMEALTTRVFIIEDEAMIAAHLSEIVASLGHATVAVATTHADAVEMASQEEFGLILADIRLADGSSGIDAVNDIRKTWNGPVIFITAYPEALLTGEGQEPVFLIPKPFRVDLVKAVISQALIGRH